MVVGTLQVDMIVSESHSLKARRRVVRSLKDRIRGRFNVSVADVGDQDLWQRISLGVAVATSDRRFADEVLDKVLDLIELDGRVNIVSQSRRIE
ncbi:MAG: DUF503 family protein [Candidatus Eisenbacteria bacterium]|nr:DUF503 family protein [Candidatus Eisenbacteria bacterium]